MENSALQIQRCGLCLRVSKGVPPAAWFIDEWRILGDNFSTSEITKYTSTPGITKHTHLKITVWGAWWQAVVLGFGSRRHSQLKGIPSLQYKPFHPRFHFPHWALAFLTPASFSSCLFLPSACPLFPLIPPSLAEGRRGSVHTGSIGDAQRPVSISFACPQVWKRSYGAEPPPRSFKWPICNSELGPKGSKQTRCQEPGLRTKADAALWCNDNTLNKSAETMPENSNQNSIEFSGVSGKRHSRIPWYES